MIFEEWEKKKIIFKIFFTAAAENIDCYSCYEGDDTLYAILGVAGNGLVTFPKDKCKDNITESTVVPTDPSKYLCTKLDFSGNYS